MTINKNAAQVIHTLKNSGYNAVLVGGCVRDFILGKEPHDWDIATDAKPRQIEALFKKSIPVGKYFGIITVIEGGESFEVATFRSDGVYEDGRRPTQVKFSSMQEDARRRDLTINGLFYDIDSDKIIDYVGGQQDLKDGIIKFIGNPNDRIKEDHLRILRAVRFALRYNFSIDAETLSAIEDNAYLLHKISAERIRDELDNIFSTGNCAKSLLFLDKTGVLIHVLPEINNFHGCQQSPKWHPEGDVWNHTLLVLNNLPHNANSIMVWSAIFHDVGKPTTTVLNKNKEWTAPFHEREGETITRAILERLKFPNSFIDSVCFVVGNHMKIKQADTMRKSHIKTLMANPDADNLIKVSYADSMAGYGKNELTWYKFIQDNIEQWKKEELQPKPILTGIDLIGLGLKPSPQFGKILSAVYDEQLDGTVVSKESAIILAKTLLTKIEV